MVEEARADVAAQRVDALGAHALATDVQARKERLRAARAARERQAECEGAEGEAGAEVDGA